MSRAARLALVTWLTGALASGALAAERPTYRDSRPMPVAVAYVMPTQQPTTAPSLPAVASTPAPTPSRTASTAALSGVASWYCLPRVSPCTSQFGASGEYAAAGPALRRNKGWRGSYVVVRRGDVAVRVRLIDWCECPGGRLLDLYGGVFRKLAPLGVGLVTVEVSW